MLTVLYVAVAAAFVLGLAFIAAYSRGNRSVAAASGVAGAAREADAAALRQVALTEAESIRRSAVAEAEAIRRAAEVETAAARSVLESARIRADADAADLLEQARRRGQTEQARVLAEAHAEQRTVSDRAQALAQERRDLAEQLAVRTGRLDAERSDVAARTVALRSEAAELTARSTALDERLRDLEERATQLADRDAALRATEQRSIAELSRVAGLTPEEAKAELLTAVEAGARRDAAALVRTIENEAQAHGTELARAVVVEAVQRVASEQTAETVVSVLALPAEEMKGRIIGREGRNIRAFEAITGVNVIIDDTPEAVLLSCFDPVRREIGRLTLQKLILDGRIHPHRIEELYETSKADVDQLCLRAATDALAEVGIADLDERLLPTLGRLKYRTSYGQNVLGHLIETAHIAGVMAAELGIEPTLVRRAAFLHDIGKALTHEVEGSHAIIGAELLRRHGESEAVVHAVEAHHNEVQPRTVEAVLTQASDTCSASRPGARRESLETYVKRLSRIEQIAQAKDGVEKVFAMQAGREVRVMVHPGEVDDLEAQVIAREIAKQIEDELTYPGQIRVTVVRESRATEVAH